MSTYDIWAHTIFTGIATSISTIVLVLALYLWSANRQTQIRPSRSQKSQTRGYSSAKHVPIQATPNSNHVESSFPEKCDSNQLFVKTNKDEEVKCILKNIPILSFLCQNDFANDSFQFSLHYLDYERKTILDGDIYVVAMGAVRCACFQSSDDLKPLSFVVTSGEMITSRLGILLEITTAYLNLHHHNFYDSQFLDSQIHVKVQVEAVNESTRLVRIAPAAFAKIIESNTNDIYRMAQTMLSRFQRVTMQTLVNRLGFNRYLFLNENATVGFQVDEQPEFKEFISNIMSDIDTKISKISTYDASISSFISIKGALALGSHRKESMQIIASDSSIIMIEPNMSLFEVGQHVDCVYLLLAGRLDIGTVDISEGLFAELEGANDQSSYHHLYSVGPGHLVGHLGAFTGEGSTILVRSTQNSVLLRIPQASYELILSTDPCSLTIMLWYILHDFISPVAHFLDWGIDWRHLKAGQIVNYKGQRCESIYVLLAGRLRADMTENDNTNIGSIIKYKEFGKGACLGDVELLTGTLWPGNYYALRNSELAYIPASVLDYIFARFPETGFHLAKLIAKQAQSDHFRSGKSYESVATIAVVPHSLDSNIDEVEVRSLCKLLRKMLEDIAPTALVSEDMITPNLDNSQNHLQHTKITQLMGELEETYRFLIFQADTAFDWWTRQCIKQADCVLVLVASDVNPCANELDDYLDHFHKTLDKRIELVILSKKNDEKQCTAVCEGINAWSEERTWPKRHHILRLPFDNFMIDLKRLSRRISGTSVGLVLGGGGARGLAHVGVIKALMEAGITVDIVGGCSQGALIGSIYSMHPDPCDFKMFESTCRRMAKMLSSITDRLFDLTFPVVSYFNGARFNKTVKDILGGGTQIQNLLLNFFCISVDICHNVQRVHDRGLCWKYVRASMSLHSYLPPVSENKSLLLDGGYVNILPIDVMSDCMGARTIIAVDVSGEDSNEYYEYGAQLSGWWLLWNSWNPFLKTVKVPSMGELSQKLIWVSSNRHLKQVSKDADLLLVPPVHSYGTLDYDKFNELVQIGYDSSKPIITDFVEKNPWLTR